MREMYDTDVLLFLLHARNLVKKFKTFEVRAHPFVRAVACAGCYNDLSRFVGLQSDGSVLPEAALLKIMKSLLIDEPLVAFDMEQLLRSKLLVCARSSVSHDLSVHRLSCCCCACAETTRKGCSTCHVCVGFLAVSCCPISSDITGSSSKIKIWGRW